MEDSDKKENKNDNKIISPWSLSLELGYVIAIPIVVFGLIGRFLDKRLDSSPMFLLIGVFASMIFTGIAVYYKIKKIINK